LFRAREVLDDLATPGAAELLAMAPRHTQITPLQVNLHKHARTTPAIRQELRESPLSIAELARRYHLTKATVRKWRRRAERPTVPTARIAGTPPSRQPRRRWWWPCASPCCYPWMTCWR
jgi:DNA-binding transcriptional regulator YiaG